MLPLGDLGVADEVSLPKFHERFTLKMESPVFLEIPILENHHFYVPFIKTGGECFLVGFLKPDWSRWFVVLFNFGEEKQEQTRKKNSVLDTFFNDTLCDLVEGLLGLECMCKKCLRVLQVGSHLNIRPFL